MNKQLLKSFIKQLENQRESATNIGIDVDATIKKWKELLERLRP